MDECELIYFVTTVACAIAKCCPTEDIGILAVMFAQLGDTLATVVAKRELLENIGNSNKTDGKAKETNTDLKYENNLSNTTQNYRKPTYENNINYNNNFNFNPNKKSYSNYSDIISNIINYKIINPERNDTDNNENKDE
jgi:hypothetical protein